MGIFDERNGGSVTTFVCIMTDTREYWLPCLVLISHDLSYCTYYICTIRSMFDLHGRIKGAARALYPVYVERANMANVIIIWTILYFSTLVGAYLKILKHCILFCHGIVQRCPGQHRKTFESDKVSVSQC